MRDQFGWACCRETVRAALHRLGLLWKKARKPAQTAAPFRWLGRASRKRRAAFLGQLRPVLDGAQRDRHTLVYFDDAHIHQDADLGHGWAERGKRFHVASTSPGLSARVSFYGLYLFDQAQVRVWPYPRANGEHTIDVLRRLRAEVPDNAFTLIWHGAPYHRAKAVWAEATRPRKTTWFSLASPLCRCPATVLT